MIVVVADTSPLNYLIQINCDHVLPSLYERVFVPSAVELTKRLTRDWRDLIPESARPFNWPSESMPICYTDEKLGVRIAREQGLAVTDTLSVLCKQPGAAWLTWKGASGASARKTPPGYNAGMTAKDALDTTGERPRRNTSLWIR